MLIVNQLCGFGASDNAAGAVTLTVLTSGSVAAASTTTISGVSFGADGGEIIVVFSTQAPSPSVSSVVIAGVSAAVTARTGALPSQSSIIAAACANVPSGASGNIVITYGTGLATPGEATEYTVYRVTGRTSVGAAASDITSTATGTASTTVVMTSIDTPVGGFVLAAVMTQSTVSPAISGAGLVISTPASAYRGFAASPILTAANSNASATWTFSSSARCVCAAFSFSP
ncbi:hypothetical protein [Xanthobacter autotrophicus]|uniref:hypothetical protein n=1 Tax=Xanthobacter autotrophicus TaxID=280 RepID=UPI00372A627F